MRFNSRQEAIEALRKEVEKMSQIALSTPANFKELSTAISAAGNNVSASTLMRIWGYIESKSSPYVSTLDILSKYVGYHDFNQFCEPSDSDDSDDVISPRISVSRDLEERDRVRLTWEPGRVCMLRYLGGEQFVVEESHNSKLKPTDTFSCALIIDGEPLYLDHLTHQGEPPTAYICGKRSGIHFTIFKRKE